MQNGIILAIFGISQIGNSYQYGNIYKKFYHIERKPPPVLVATPQKQIPIIH